MVNFMVEVVFGLEVVFVVKDDVFIFCGEEGVGVMVMFNGLIGVVQFVNVLVGVLFLVFLKGSGWMVVGLIVIIGICGIGFYMVLKSQLIYVCYCYGLFEFIVNFVLQFCFEIVSSYYDKVEMIFIGVKGFELCVVLKFMNYFDVELIVVEYSVGCKVLFEC